MLQKDYYRQIDAAYSHFSGKPLEARLEELVRQAGREYGQHSAFYAAMLSEMGAFHKGQGHYEQAEDAFRASAALLKETIGGNDPNYATALNNLAGTHRLMKRYDEAESEFTVCLELYRDTVGTHHVLYASALNNLSLLALDRGDLTQAAVLLRQAAQILGELSDCADETASALVNLASLNCRIGKSGEAEQELLKAISLYETDLGTDTPHYHAALNALGLLYYDRGDHAAAVTWLRKAFEAATALYGTDHPETRAVKAHLDMAAGDGA